MLAFRFANAHVRAGLEPQLHRPRPDHRGRGHRHRHARRLLRQRRRAARPRPEPHAPAADAAVHGAAGRTSPPTRCATRRSRCCRRSTPPTPRARSPTMAVRAQYAAGVSGGEEVPGYLEEDGRARRTRTTETYAALRLEVDNWRWAGVPFYLRTGKRLARKVTEIAVTLKPVPHLAFQADGLASACSPTSSSSRCSPNEGVSLSLGAKIPGHADAHPAGEHGVPLRHVVPVAVAGGLRAADPRRDARRRDAVHAQRRGRGAVARSATRSSRRGQATPGRCRSTRPGLAGPDGGRRAARARPRAGGRSDGAPTTPTAVWSAEDTTPGRDRGGAARAAHASSHARDRGLRRPRACSTSSCVVDREWRGEIDNRLEQRRAATTPRARSSARSSPGARRSTPSATIASDGEPEAGRARARCASA